MTDRLLSPERALLLIIDLQERFVPVIDGAQALLGRVEILIEAAKRLELPVVVSEQYPKGLGHTAERLRGRLPPGAAVLEKTAFGCLADAGLRETLNAVGREQVLVCGVEAHVCVSQTVHQLVAAGYQAHLIEDAVGSRDPRNREIGLAKMRQAGALPSCVEMALFELMGDAKRPDFKDLQALVK